MSKKSIAALVIAGLVVIGMVNGSDGEDSPTPASSSGSSTEVVEDVVTGAEDAVEEAAAEEDVAEEDVAEEDVDEEAPEPQMTAAQENALAAAKNYLELSGFSRKGLINQLPSEYGDQYARPDAVFAVDNVGADWNEQAARSAKQYLEMSSFSRQGLIDQLSSEYGDQYTVEQATYGADAAGL